jgi:hypothetical protein
VDVNNAPQPALADGLAPSGAALALPLRVRWRQRTVARGRSAPAGDPGAPPARNTHAAHAATTLQTAQAAPAAPPGSNDAAPSLETPAAHASRGAPAAPSALTFVAADADASDAHAHTDAGSRSRSGSRSRARAGADVDADVDADADVDGDKEADADADANARAGSRVAAGAHAHARANAAHGAGIAHIDSRADALTASASADIGADAPDASSTAAAAPTPDSDDPQRAPRDIELWLLARRAQGAALRLDFELRTALARQVFRRDFVYVSRQLHALEASRRVQGLDRARLDDALATLRRRGDVIEAFMNQRTSELQAAIDARGAASARIAFARPARFQATIVSPGAHRFLALLLRADETLARLEMAWLLGLVEPATRSALVSDCRRALLGFKDLACDLRRAVGLLIQEVNAQRGAGGASRDA